MKRKTFSKFFLHQGLILLIVIYFAFHGYVVHFGSVPSGSLVLLSLVLIAVSLIVQRLLNLVFKNEGKATIYTAFLLLIILLNCKLEALKFISNPNFNSTSFQIIFSLSNIQIRKFCSSFYFNWNFLLN